MPLRQVILKAKCKREHNMHQLTIPDLFKSWTLAPYCCLFHDKLRCHVWLTANTNKLVKKLNPDFLNIFYKLNREISVLFETCWQCVLSWLLIDLVLLCLQPMERCTDTVWQIDTTERKQHRQNNGETQKLIRQKYVHKQSKLESQRNVAYNKNKI